MNHNCLASIYCRCITKPQLKPEIRKPLYVKSKPPSIIESILFCLSAFGWCYLPQFVSVSEFHPIVGGAVLPPLVVCGENPTNSRGFFLRPVGDSDSQLCDSDLGR